MRSDGLGHEARDSDAADISLSNSLYKISWARTDVADTPIGNEPVVIIAGDDDVLLGMLAREAQNLACRGMVIGPPREGADAGADDMTLPSSSADWTAFWSSRPATDEVTVVLAMKSPDLPQQLDSGHDVAGSGAKLCMSAVSGVVGLDESPVSGRFFIVTRGARQVTDSDTVTGVHHGLLHGLAPVLGLEFPATWGGIIDLPSHPAASDVGALLRVVLRRTAEDLAAVREGEVLGARLREVPRTDEELPVRADGTYVITGGLGGIGRRIASDLAGRGARHLVLIGRTPEEELNTAARKALSALGESGVDVRYEAADCDDLAALREIFHGAGSMPPVRGVVHAAGVGSSRPLREVGHYDFAAALRGKFTGGWWLHVLSRDWPLDFFIVTSSASATWGNEGSGAYAAANGGLDSLAACRATAGQTARSIAFGPWNLDGMANSAERDALRQIGVHALSPESGCAHLLASAPDSATLLACPVDWGVFGEVMATRRSRPLFAEVAPAQRVEDRHEPVTHSPAARLLGLPERARVDTARRYISRILADTLGYSSEQSLSGDVGFFQIGLTSIMAVDFKRRLSKEFGVELRVSAVFDNPTIVELADHILNLLSEAQVEAGGSATDIPVGTTTASNGPAASKDSESQDSPGVSASEPIAIVGMAGRFPGADTVDELWELLCAGTDGVGPLPAGRWESTGSGDDAFWRENAEVRRGGFIEDIARFDAAFFDVSAREAENMDPQHRLLLESTWHAIEDASVDPKSLKGSRIGVYVGISNSDYARLLEQGGLEQLDAYSVTGISLNAAAGRIAFLLGLHGPAVAVDSACSSSLVALHLAIRSLRNGEVDCALAGGVNVIASPVASVVTHRAHMLSPSGRCNTFSADADGFVRAEGCGVVMLKRLSDAERDGDRIVALLHGSAVNQDGASSGFTAPNGKAQQAVIEAALADAGVDAASVSYLEAHGTGTALGDPVEVNAAWAVLGRHRLPGNTLHLGSIKSNVGHCESAAGVVGVIKTALALQKEWLPGNLHCEELNPQVAWSDMNVRVVDAGTPWRRRSERPRFAGVSGFGASGTNAHIVVGEAPVRSTTEPGEDPCLVPLSAPDTAGLARLTESWEKHLTGASPADIPALAAAAGQGRAHFPVRRAVLGRAKDDLLGQLRTAAASGITRSPRVAYLFSGQGSQYFGMGRRLYETEPVYREKFDRCDEITAPALGVTLRELMFDGSDRKLINETRYAQPGLVAMQLSLAALWESWGVSASAVMGHSVGEITAAIHAGVMSLESGLALVTRRARLMQGVDPGGMLAITASAAEVAEWLQGSDLDIAAVNGPTSVVVSGTHGQIEATAARMRERGVAARLLVTSHAFHSRMMDPVLAELASAAARFEYQVPKVPIVSNVTGRVATAHDYEAAYWAQHVRQPVRFHDGLRQLGELGVDVFLEIGPDTKLKNLTSAAELTSDAAFVSSLRRGGNDRSSMLTAVKELYECGQDVRWAAVQAASGRSRGPAPLYPFAATRHWTKVRPRTEAAARPAAATDVRHWGAELRSPALAGRVFAFHRSAEFPRHLDDHRLYDSTVVTPAASHLATVLSALAGDGRPFAVEDFVCPRALVIKDDEQYEAQIVVSDEGGVEKVSVVSLVDPENTRWIEHVSGRVGKPAPAPHPAPDPEEFIASAEQHFSGDECYAFMRALGYTLGPSFCWIADVWVRGDESLVRYAQPVLPDDPADYEIYPGLIDSFFQSTVGFMIDTDVSESSSLSIPFAAAKISVPGRPRAASELYGHVRALEFSELPHGRRRVDMADLHIFTEDGGSVFVAEQFRVRQAPRTVLEGSLRAASSMAYEVVWVEQPQPTEPPLGGRTVALLGECPELVPRLETALRAQGHRVVVEPGVASLATEDDFDLIVDARFCTADLTTAADDVLAASIRLTATLQNAGRRTPYAVLTDGASSASPLREALSGLLTALEAEAPDRRLIRATLAEGWTPSALARVLSHSLDSGIPETRLAVGGDGVLVARLKRVDDHPGKAEWKGSALITGGLGALGLSTAKLLAERGVRTITLMGRSDPDSTARHAIGGLEAMGVRVNVVSGDVRDPAACARAVVSAGEHEPLAAVFHLAGETKDRAFEHLTPADFERVFAAKAQGADVLAAATRNADLRILVFFSSASAVLGSRGQANYAAANGYLNGLVETLRSAGTPAKSIQWGPWIPDVTGGGMAAAISDSGSFESGIRALGDEEAARLWDLTVAGPSSTPVAVSADFETYAADVSGGPREPLVSGLYIADKRAKTADEDAFEKGWLRQQLQATEPTERMDVLSVAIREMVLDVLGEDDIDTELDFEDMGIDSIMSIDLRNRLAHALDVELPATIAIDYRNVGEMAGFATSVAL
ncbi:SDR family NAD(P)-dependent oxidoreductase [Streptomyces sp. NPDC004376]